MSASRRNPNPKKLNSGKMGPVPTFPGGGKLALLRGKPPSDGLRPWYASTLIHGDARERCLLDFLFQGGFAGGVLGAFGRRIGSCCCAQRGACCGGGKLLLSLLIGEERSERGDERQHRHG